jgi:methionyl-tRNA formyltransferase
MSAGRPRVVLVGIGPTTADALAGLAEETDLVALVRPGDDDVVAEARRLGVEVTDADTVAAVREVVTRTVPDCVVVSSFHRILPADLVQACPFVNVHYAPLPRLRGRATVNWAILNGETEATISVHRLVAGLDAGGVLHAEQVPIGPRATVGEVYADLNRIQRTALPAAVRAVLAGDEGVPQDEAAATYACTRVPEDGEIDWSGTTAAADRLVRALGPPFPGAFTWLGLDQLVVEEAEPAADAARWEGRVPGRVVRVDRAGGTVDVLTGDGVLRLRRLRDAAGQSRPAAEVVRSVRATLGLRTADLVRRLRELGG